MRYIIIRILLFIAGGALLLFSVVNNYPDYEVGGLGILLIILSIAWENVGGAIKEVMHEQDFHK